VKTGVLAVNAGSSSLKFTYFDDTLRPRVTGAVEGIGAQAHAWVDEGPRRAVEAHDHAAAIAVAQDLLAAAGAPTPRVVGHRVVHGGVEYTAPVRVDAALLRYLHTIVPLAPLHLPAALIGIEAVAARDPRAPQVACFDTAFHASLPEVARRLPLPPRFHEEGIRRYGFHGLSYESVLETLGAERPARIVIAHLGAGASLVAVREGRAIDTTMGFTPGGGIPMATRTGDLDPGVVVYLAREERMSADAIERLVERESGLLGVGGSADMKTLLARAETDAAARLAVTLFAYAVRKAIGAFAAALGGTDLLVFTGGIGEHAPAVRQEACQGLDAFGLALDDAANRKNATFISAPGSRCAIRVIPTDEDRVIARHALRVVASA
jgi:acetate kinase